MCFFSDFMCSWLVKGERNREERSQEHFVLFRLQSMHPAADAQQAGPSTSLFSRRVDVNVPPYKESSIASDSSSVMQWAFPQATVSDVLRLHCWKWSKHKTDFHSQKRLNCVFSHFKRNSPNKEILEDCYIWNPSGLSDTPCYICVLMSGREFL